MNTVIYMQQKFPLTNKLIISPSGLDPTAMGHSATYNCLKRLSEQSLLIWCRKKATYKKYQIFN